MEIKKTHSETQDEGIEIYGRHKEKGWKNMILTGFTEGNMQRNIQGLT